MMCHVCTEYVKQKGYNLVSSFVLQHSFFFAIFASYDGPNKLEVRRIPSATSLLNDSYNTLTPRSVTLVVER